MHRQTVFLLILLISPAVMSDEEPSASHTWQVDALPPSDRGQVVGSGLSPAPVTPRLFRPGPEARTVRVDCDRGQSINSALELPARELIVEVHGICVEHVIIQRDRVVLRGSDPSLDGIRWSEADPVEGGVVTTIDATSVILENLSITGSANVGVSARRTEGLLLSNCVVAENADWGVHANQSRVMIFNSAIGTATYGGVSAVSSAHVMSYESLIEGDLHIAMFASQGSSLSIFGGRIRGGVAVTAVASLAELSGGVEFSGGIFCDGQGFVVLDGAESIGPHSSYAIVRGDSYLRIASSTQNGVPLPSVLSGWVIAAEFSRLYVDRHSTVGGDVTCVSAGDAFAEPGSAMGGTVTGCRSLTGP